MFHDCWNQRLIIFGQRSMATNKKKDKSANMKATREGRFCHYTRCQKKSTNKILIFFCRLTNKQLTHVQLHLNATWRKMNESLFIFLLFFHFPGEYLCIPSVLWVNSLNDWRWQRTNNDKSSMFTKYCMHEGWRTMKM